MLHADHASPRHCKLGQPDDERMFKSCTRYASIHVRDAALREVLPGPEMYAATSGIACPNPDTSVDAVALNCNLSLCLPIAMMPGHHHHHGQAGRRDSSNQIHSRSKADRRYIKLPCEWLIMLAVGRVTFGFNVALS